MNVNEILNWKPEKEKETTKSGGSSSRGMTVSEILSYKPTETTRRNFTETDRPKSTVRRDPEQEAIQNAVATRTYNRSQATRNRDNARNDLRSLENEKAQIASYITDDFTASMYADRLAELDRQIADAKKTYKSSKDTYDDVFTDYNAARKEVKQANRALRIQQENTTDNNYAENLKAAEDRLAAARQAFAAQGGNPDANVISAGLRGSASGVLDTFGYLQELAQPENEKSWGIFTTGHLTDEQKRRQQVLEQRRKARYEAEHGAGTYEEMPQYQRTQNVAGRLANESAEEITSMKTGRGEVGQLAVDMGVQGVQMLADQAAGRVLPGGPLTAMGLRSFGSAVREAREEGANIYQQGLYGAGSAAVEILSEKMFDGLAGIYGAGFADDMVSRMIGKFTDNKLGQAALGWAVDALGEGAEEVASDLANPILKMIYNDKSLVESFRDNWDWSEVGYDFLVGAAMGFVGGSVENVANMTGLSAPDARSDFFMMAGQNGMDFKTAMKEWQRHMIKEGYATETSDTEITNKANELLQSIDENKFDPLKIRARSINRQIDKLNQRATNQIAQEDIANTSLAVQQRMQELGVDDKRLAQAVAAIALENEAERIGAKGVNVTETQRKMVKDSKVAQRVLFEMDVENMRGEQRAGIEAFIQNKSKGATKEDYDRAVNPYARTNEWAKTMQQNKALAKDVYGGKTTLTDAEKTGNYSFTTKKGKQLEGQIVGVRDGKVRIKHGTQMAEVGIDKINGLSDGYRVLLEAAMSRKNGNEMLAAYRPGQDIATYLRQWDLAENAYGLTNISNETARKAFSLRDLTDTQLEIALDLGRAEAKNKGTTEQAKAQKVTGELSYWEGGKIDGMEYDSTTEEEARELLGENEFSFASDVLSQIVNVTFVKSKAGKNGFTGAQGIFFRDGRVFLDVNAGLDTMDVGQRTIVLTAAHELTHYIRAYNEEAYNALQKFIATELVNQGKNIEDFIRDKQRRSGWKISYDEAMEEVVADACEMMLTDAEQISSFASEHTGEARTIWKWLDKFYTRVENAFGGLKTRHSEAEAMQGRVEELRKMWLDALAGANENALAAQAENPSDAVHELDGAIESNGYIRPSLRTFDEEGRDTLNEFLDKQVNETKALTQEEADQMRKQIEDIYKVCKEYDNGEFAPFSAWSNAEVVTYDGRPVFSVVKQNGEYKLNLDFSLVCKKRRTLDAVFNEMIRRGIMNDFKMGPGSIAKINQIIREHGFETACGLCFVDSKRYRQAMIADAFCAMYNMQVFSLMKGTGAKIAWFNYGGDETITNPENTIDTMSDDKLNWSKVDEILKTEKKGTVKYKIADYLKNNPQARKLVTRGDFMSTAGFDALKANNPDLLSLYNSKKGAGGPKAAQSDVQYLNEIISSNSFNQKAAYEVGGVRIQSFSDYVGRLVFDYVQMVADLSAKKLPAHSYTKEFMFAQQFGLTGIKINMSLVPAVVKGGVAAGLDANGDYAWKDGQSFGSTVYDNKGKRLTAAEGFQLAIKIQNAKGYSKNCGTIAVGVSDAHINKMLDDPNIKMIIPYHKSGLNHLVAAMEQIDKYTDYTNIQNTRSYKNGKWSKIGPANEFNFNDALQKAWAEGKGAKEAADEYLAWCKENGYKPKFDQFAGHPNYYKLLEDFNCYDSDGVTSTPMGEVQMNFPTESDAFGSMKDLIKSGLEEDAMLQAKQEGGVDDIVDEIQSVLPEWEAAHPEGKKAKATVKLSAREATEATDVGTETKMISENMTEEERYEVLKDKKITVYPYNQDRFAELQKNDYEELNKLLQGEYFDKTRAFNLLRTLGKNFKTFKDYFNKDISVTFEYSISSLRHSNNKQESSEAASLAKMFTVFDQVIENAIGIEAHGKRYEYEKNNDSPLEKSYILFGAFRDGSEIVPVRAMVKIYSDKTQPKLDVVVTMSKINEADVIRDIALDVTAENSSPQSASTYMLADLLQNVNPEDTGLLKYIPDGFLDDQRFDGKLRGIENTEEYKAAKERRKAEKAAKKSDRDVNTFTTRAEIDAEIERVQDQIRDIQNAQWNAVEAAKNDPRVQDAQKKMWAAEDEKGYTGAARERIEYRRMLKQVKEELAAHVPEGDLNELAERVKGLKELREQFLNVTPITAAQYDKLSKHFGTTKDYSAAGFILKDGRMLDFSGKKQYGKAYAGGREIYHNEVGDVLNLPTDTSPRIDMVSNGNIRLVPEINGINLSQKPTAQQKDALRGFIEHNNGNVHVDIDNAAGRTIDSFGYFKNTSAAKILADIDRYFETGETPAPQSDLHAYLSLRDNAAVQEAKEHGREQLNKLRAEKNAKIEEIRKEETARRQAAVKKEKAAKWEKVKETKDYYHDMMNRQRGKRYDTNVRGKIKALHKELSDMLVNPKEGKYVPKELVKATAEILGAVDTTSKRAVKAKEALAKLRVQYDALKEDPKYAMTYDETVSGMLQEIAQDMGDQQIYELTGSDLEGVYNTLKALKHAIRTANQLVGAQIEATAFEAAQKMMDEAENAKGISTKYLRKFVFSQLSPERFGRLLSGYRKNGMWQQMMNMLNEGQRKQTQIMMEGGEIFRELIGDKKHPNKNLKTLHDTHKLVDIGLKDQNGNAVKITRGMMLSVYMHLQNEDNARHIAYGGFTVPKFAEYYKGKMTDAFTGKTGRAVAYAAEMAELSKEMETADVMRQEEIKERLAELEDMTASYIEELRENIENQLTDYDRQWIRATQKFFDEYSKEKLNEVTEMVYGFEKAQVDNYFPIHTDQKFRTASFDSIARDMSLENAGFMKKRVYGANPIQLEDITDVVSTQLRKTAQYVGLMPAIRNFNKAYGKALAGYTMSVQEAVSQTFHNEGLKYIENLMADLNGARRTEADIFDEIRGNVAGAALMLSPRVTLAQTASYPTAAAEIGYAPLAKAMKDIAKNPMFNAQAAEEIAKWTPLWWYRMQGFSTVELGDIKSNEQLMNKIMSRMTWATGWIQFADGLTTGGLWQASKYYVDDHFSNLEKGSDEYMMKVAETYNRVIEATQPNYTTMQRPDILRNPNKMIKQFTMFLTQRLQNFNLMYDAVATYNAYTRDYKAGKNGVTKADVNAAGTKLAWTMSSQIVASSMIVMFKYLADRILHNMKAYRDDDDEITAESTAKTLLVMFGDTIMSNILLGSEVFDIVKKWTTGDKYYGISISSVEAINDVLTNFANGGYKILHGEDASKEAAALAKKLAQALGIPYNNAAKIVDGIRLHVEDIENGEFGSFEAGVDRTKAQNTRLLFEAYQSGDTAKANRIKEEFADVKEERAALKSYIKELYTGEDQKIQKAETISLLQKYCGMTKKAAENLAQEWTMEVVTGVKYSDLADQFIAGKVPKQKAVQYLKTYKFMTEAEAEAKVLEWQCEKDTGIAYADIPNAVKIGELSADKAMQLLMKYGGKDEEKAAKTVQGYAIEHEYGFSPSDLEEEYLAGNVSDEDALEILQRYKYYGKDESETKAQEELERLQFIRENPDAEDISITQVRNYNASGLKGIVSASDYAQAAKMMGTFEGVDADGDGKTDRYSVIYQKLDYIDSLDLTSEQKTALAISLGLNEKTIRRKAPWL